MEISTLVALVNLVKYWVEFRTPDYLTVLLY